LPEETLALDLGHLHVPQFEDQPLGKIPDHVLREVRKEEHPVPRHEVVVDPELGLRSGGIRDARLRNRRRGQGDHETQQL
jgi:hypothetical protein